MTTKNVRYNTAAMEERIKAKQESGEMKAFEKAKPGSYSFKDLMNEPRGKRTPWKK